MQTRFVQLMLTGLLLGGTSALGQIVQTDHFVSSSRLTEVHYFEWTDTGCYPECELYDVIQLSLGFEITDAFLVGFEHSDDSQTISPDRVSAEVELLSYNPWTGEAGVRLLSRLVGSNMTTTSTRLSFMILQVQSSEAAFIAGDPSGCVGNGSCDDIWLTDSVPQWKVPVGVGLHTWDVGRHSPGGNGISEIGQMVKVTYATDKDVEVEYGCAFEDGTAPSMFCSATGKMIFFNPLELEPLGTLPFSGPPLSWEQVVSNSSVTQLDYISNLPSTPPSLAASSGFLNLFSGALLTFDSGPFEIWNLMAMTDNFVMAWPPDVFSDYQSFLGTDFGMINTESYNYDQHRTIGFLQ